MNKSYLVLALVALVIVSGCSQASTISDSFKKLKALEAGPGYSADYVMNFKIQLNDKLKSAAATDPTAAAGLARLENIPDINLKLSGAKKADKERSSVDTTGLEALTGETGANIPFKTMAVYQDKDQATICLQIKEQLLCTKGTKEELAAKIPNIAQQINAANQFSEQSPDKLLEQFKKLYDKGALKLGPQGKNTIIGRQCDQISYTVGDLSKLDSKELLAALGPFGSQLATTSNVDESQLVQAAFLIKQIIKEIKQEFCFDSTYGLPLSSTYSLEIDISAVAKLAAGIGGSSATSDQKIPEGAGFSIKLMTTATSVKSPIDDSEFKLPENAKLESVDSLLAKAPELKGQEVLAPA